MRQHVRATQSKIGECCPCMSSRKSRIEFERALERFERPLRWARTVVREIEAALQVGLFCCGACRANLRQSSRFGARDWSVDSCRQGARRIRQERGDLSTRTSKTSRPQRRTRSCREQLRVQPHVAAAILGSQGPLEHGVDAERLGDFRGWTIGFLERQRRPKCSRSQRLNLTERRDQLFSHGIADIG